MSTVGVVFQSSHNDILDTKSKERFISEQLGELCCANLCDQFWVVVSDGGRSPGLYISFNTE